MFGWQKISGADAQRIKNYMKSRLHGRQQGTQINFRVDKRKFKGARVRALWTEEGFLITLEINYYVMGFRGKPREDMGINEAIDKTTYQAVLKM